MEKRTPHYLLSKIKDLINEKKVRFTGAALAGAAALGLDADGIVDILRVLEMKDFFKSMTTYNDHKVWQDVYKSTTHVGEVYLKLTVYDDTDVLIVSFKEL